MSNDRKYTALVLFLMGNFTIWFFPIIALLLWVLGFIMLGLHIYYEETEA